MAQYIGIDKERYDQGDKFLSQDRYLANYNPRDAITFNVSSPVNTGIFGPGINPFPIIPQEGDGGGGITPGGNSKFDYEFEALGGLNNPDNVPLSEEEQDILDAQKNKDRLTQAAQLGLFALNPVNYLMGKVARKGIGMAKDKFFGGNDGDGGGFDQDQYDAGKASAAAQAAANRDYARSGGDDGASSSGSTGSMSASDFSDDTAGTPFEYGGRVGYSGEGLSKYEIFKLGELGFNTKGGTVLEPFGGIKVLRDILKVNQYAGGGIVGLFR